MDINPNCFLICLNSFITIGDLTDEVAPDKLVATQFEQEWVIYKNFYQQCLNVSGTKTWLDIRGNHGILLNPICIILLFTTNLN